MTVSSDSIQIQIPFGKRDLPQDAWWRMTSFSSRFQDPLALQAWPAIG